MPGFKVYKGELSRDRSSRPATVTVMKSGLFSFSPAAIAALGDPDYVLFLYDRNTQRIGFREATKGTPHSYRVRAIGNGTHVVTAIAFLRFLGADLAETRRYPLLPSRDGHYISLAGPGVVVRGNRRGD